ncbi:MAG: YdeI/OmpD-associated family protein [Acidobacteriaceae bacterium]
MAAIQTLGPKVDAYFAKVPPFALPIMAHLRELVHKGCPDVEETIKWSRPFFEYRGAILCNISAFKEHCSFGFWGEEMGAVLREAGVLGKDGMGSLGRITSLSDLPSDKKMLSWIRQAAAFIDNGQQRSPISARQKVVKPALQTPAEFTSALKRNKKAASVFEAFSPSCKKEYVEWIGEAKRPETRDKRIATAVEWIAEGKQRNWKYQNC